ncbi:MAG: RnfH family protein [Pseudomonadota bacterium]
MTEPIAARTVSVEVSYALPDRQRIVTLVVPIGTTARQAALASRLRRYFPELDLAAVPLGVWGRRVADDTPLAEGDRVELYRPLRASARQQRRERAQQAN